MEAMMPASEAAVAGDERLVVLFHEVDRASLALVGGKGANLGELSRAGFPVPPGFCVTTTAYEHAAAGAALEPALDALDDAANLPPDRLAALAAQARAALLEAPIPAAVEAAIRAAYAALGGPVAVRSSATAEDTAEASFAGQQDTYLNIVGADAVVDAVRRCWASLWTDRAVVYRTRNGIDHRGVRLAAVVQALVDAAVSGVLFTANPLTNRRNQAVIDATPGLGEALVSGMVNPDHFVVDTPTLTISERRLAAKHVAIRPQSGGGIAEIALGEAGAAASVTDEQAVAVARLGASVEAHYGAPQDIEWALDERGKLWLLQARPITTLLPPLSPPRPDDDFRVSFSFNVAQGVFQPFTPMGAEFFRQVVRGAARLAGVPFGPEQGPLVLGESAGRLYLDITTPLRSSAGRRALGAALANMEPRTAEVIQGLLDDPRLAPPADESRGQLVRWLGPFMWRTKLPLRVLAALLRPTRARRAVERRIRTFLAADAEPPRSPVAALNQVERLAQGVPPMLLLHIAPPALMAGGGSLALAWRLAAHAGAASEMQLVTRGLPHNVTTSMNLELWQISRRLRADDEARRALETLPAPELAARFLAGTLPACIGREVGAFLGSYGFRGVAEIDVGVPRWRDDPGPIFAILANYLRQSDPGLAPDVQFRRAAAEAEAAMERIRDKVRRAGPLGRPRAALLGILFRRVRALFGLRESPKFYAVATIARCRTLLQGVGATLARAGRLERADDIFFLTLAEARAAIAGDDPRERVRERRAAHAREQGRKRLPRVLLSDGTALFGEAAAGAGAQPGALHGSAASPGSYTGVARVILDPAGARLEPGEILVAPSTDPGWTPLFLTAGALVMEMGGMMSHGAVVAREYGIPAVVGVLGATGAIRDGQRITVDGERGVVMVG
jgi:pyruvate,water dikinase